MSGKILVIFITLLSGQYTLNAAPPNRGGGATQPAGSAKEDLKSTPLIEAIVHRDFDVAKKLIRNGADVNERDRAGYTPLYLASEVPIGMEDIVDLLLDHGATINARSPGDATALHAACDSGSAKIVAALIKHGADIDAVTLGKYTPLHAAAFLRSRDSVEIIRILLANGAKRELRSMRGERPIDILNTVEIVTRSDYECRELARHILNGK